MTQSNPSCVESFCGFKTTDGRLFATRAEAEEHQWIVDIRPSIAKHCSSSMDHYTKRHAMGIILHWERCKREGKV